MEDFITELSWFFKWLVASSIQVSVLVCLILVIKAVVRGRLAVRWHYWLWLLLLARMVMPWAPESRFSMFSVVPQVTKVIAAKQIAKVTPTPSTVVVKPKVTQGVTPKATNIQQNQESVESISTAPQSIQTSASTGQLSFELIDILSLSWFIVALGFATFALACNFRLWRIIKSQRPLTEGKILDLLEDCKTEMGIQTILGVIMSGRVKSPAIFGVVRPRLLLPEGMTEMLNREELRYVFLHELAHLKRRDIYLGWFMVVLQALHWFNPLVWLAFAQMRADRELACDSLVLSTLGVNESQGYGRTIVNLFKGFSQIQYVPGIAGILENKSQLERRIIMIAQFKKGTYGWSILAIILLAVLGSVALTNGRTIKGDSSALVKIMPEDLYKNLVLYYSFDKDGGTKVVDISGMDFHGKVHGASWIEEGASVGAMSFDGEDDYVEIDDSDSLNITNEITLSSWINPCHLSGSQFIVAKWQYRNINCSYGCRLDNENLRFCLAKGHNKTVKTFTDLQVIANTWNHIVVTYDGNVMKGYVNSIPSSQTESFAGPINSTSEPVAIGYNPNYSGTGVGGHYFNGQIDEVALFNRALSELEVGQLYRIASGLTTESGKIKPTGLVGHWSFDNDDGDTVIDSSPYANHGKLKTAANETAIAKWASQKNVSKLLNEADSFVTQMAQAKEREDWDSVDVGAQKLWYILRKLKTTLPRRTPSRALESTKFGGELGEALEPNLLRDALGGGIERRTGFLTAAPQYYREEVPELNDCISRLEELCDNLHSTIRDKKMSVVSEIYQEFNKQWTHFNSITQFKPADGKTGPTLVDGMLGKAYDFDGVDGGVYIEGSAGTGSVLNIYNTDITISAWVNIRTGGSIVARAKPHYITYQLRAFTKAYVNMYISPVHYQVETDEILLPNTWYHIVGVFDRASDKGYVYINGVLEAEGPLPDAPSTNDGLTKIGCRNSATDGTFDGKIDDVRIYDRALTAEEIRQLYNLTNLEEQVPTKIQPSKQKPTGPQWVLYQRPNAVANYALKFDGLDDFVQVPRSESLEPNEEITVELWAFLDGGQSRNARLVRKAGAMAPGYLLAADQTGDGTMQFRIDRGRGSVTRAADKQTNLAYAGQWHHFAGVYSRTHAHFYIDGIEVSKIRHVGLKIYHSSVDLYIGHGSYSSSEHFKGAIDEVRIWSIARSQVDIQKDMYRTLNGSESGLVGYWKFDEGEGDTVQDSSGKGNHGKLGQTQRRTPWTGYRRW